MPRETFDLNVLDPADFRRHRDVVAFVRDGPFESLMMLVSTFVEFPGSSAAEDAKRENRLRPARSAAWQLADDLQTVALAAVAHGKPRADAFTSLKEERSCRIDALKTLTLIANGLQETDDDGYSTPAVLELMAAHVRRLESLDGEERKARRNDAAAQDRAGATIEGGAGA